VVAWAIAIDGVWQTLAVVFVGAPLTLIVAAWPLALGQALRALADIGENVSFDALAPAPARHSA
jgi:hypothetical protein